MCNLSSTRAAVNQLCKSYPFWDVVIPSVNKVRKKWPNAILPCIWVWTCCMANTVFKLLWNITVNYTESVFVIRLWIQKLSRWCLSNAWWLLLYPPSRTCVGYFQRTPTDPDTWRVQLYYTHRFINNWTTDCLIRLCVECCSRFVYQSPQTGLFLSWSPQTHQMVSVCFIILVNLILHL